MDARFLRLLFLAALLIRLAFVWQIRELPTQRWLVMDAQRYDELARGIAAGGWIPREAFYQAPLYPYVLATIYAVTGSSLLAVRLLQAVLGALTVVLLAVLSRRLFGRDAGRAAGILAALYGPAIFYVPLLLKSTLTLLALTGAVLLLVGPHPLAPSPAPPAALPGRGGKGRALGAGVLFGVSALLQENLILLVPFAALWLLISEGERVHRSRVVAVGALAMGTMLGVAPATLLNFSAGGEAVLTSSQGGMNFFIGNAHGATGTYTGLASGSQDPQSQREAARRLAAVFASRERGRPVALDDLTPGEISGLFWRETFRQIRDDPAAWGRLLLRKARLFWNVHEIPDAEGYDVYRREAGPLTGLWIGFGILAPLGLGGLVLAWRDPDPRVRRGARLLVLLLLGMFVSVVLFFVFGRYRLPVVVLLIPPAGHALATLFEAVRRRQPRRLALAGAIAVFAALAVNLPAWSAAERERLNTGIWINLSTAALRGAEAAATEGRPEEAVALTTRAADDLARVLEVDPGFFVARVQRATALNRRGSYLAAAGALEPALASYGEARRELATALTSGAPEDLPEAGQQARELAAALDANTVNALVNLGGRRIEAGDLETAEAALRRAVALAPGSAPAHGNLGLCLLRQERREASRASFARALELAGPDARPGEVAFYRRGLDMAGEPLEPGRR
jgi:tetratricopeptide (TPR) repeat protein